MSEAPFSRVSLKALSAALNRFALVVRPLAKLSSAASVNLDISHLVPSDPSNNYEPDYSYALTIKTNSIFKDPGSNTNFITTKAARFDFSSSFEPTVKDIYQYDTNNNPEYWLLQKTVPAISTKKVTQKFTIGTPTKYKTLNIFDSDIIYRPNDPNFGIQKSMRMLIFAGIETKGSRFVCFLPSRKSGKKITASATMMMVPTSLFFKADDTVFSR